MLEVALRDALTGFANCDTQTPPTEVSMAFKRLFAIGICLFFSQVGAAQEIRTPTELKIQAPLVASTVEVLSLNPDESLGETRQALITRGVRGEKGSRVRLIYLHLTLEEAANLSREVPWSPRKESPCKLVKVEHAQRWLDLPENLEPEAFDTYNMTEIHICSYSFQMQISSDERELKVQQASCLLHADEQGTVEIRGGRPIVSSTFTSSQVKGLDTDEVLNQLGCTLIHKVWNGMPR